MAREGKRAYKLRRRSHVSHPRSREIVSHNEESIRPSRELLAWASFSPCARPWAALVPAFRSFPTFRRIERAALRIGGSIEPARRKPALPGLLPLSSLRENTHYRSRREQKVQRGTYGWGGPQERGRARRCMGTTHSPCTASLVADSATFDLRSIYPRLGSARRPRELLRNADALVTTFLGRSHRRFDDFARTTARGAIAPEFREGIALSVDRDKKTANSVPISRSAPPSIKRRTRRRRKHTRPCHVRTYIHKLLHYYIYTGTRRGDKCSFVLCI